MRMDPSTKKKLLRLPWSGLALAAILWQSIVLSSTLASALPHGFPPGAAFDPTKTACRFTSGPRAGTTGDYVAPHVLKVGSGCEDGRGSQGIVVVREETGSKSSLPEPQKRAETPTKAASVPKPYPGSAPTQAPTQNQPQYEVSAPKAATAPAPMPAPIQVAPPASKVATQPPIVPPAVQPPMASTPHPAPAVSYANLTDSQIQQELDQIVKRAKNGAIRDNVPSAMTVGRPVTVMVEVYGANAQPQTTDDFHATGTGSLKVTPLMEVILDQRENPYSFKIEPYLVQTGQQIVPDDDKVDWVWTVTPLRSGSQMKLDIDAYMVLNAKLPSGQASSHNVLSKSVAVPVQSQPAPQAVLGFLKNNWVTLLNFLLPSGVGLAALTWFLSKRKAKADSA